MTKTFKTAIVAVLALTMGAFGLAAPAMANGQVSVSYTPTDPDEAQALGTGLQLFSIFNGMNAHGANVSQNGNGNSAGVDQNGSGNGGVVYQEGNGHTGTIHQNGNNNNCGLFQFGENTDAECVQNGDNGSSVTGVFGF
ncbi:MAG: curlin [Devosia sp.]|uniref:curlin n=1 Tax=Devosia sp. TaxID=1871048 RepID=UPI002624A007|nr:curlin [Devosia sp.]MDB5536429.1 curlin [Devosia sp.]MDB5586035.1 curlin [Devosia sp.]